MRSTLAERSVKNGRAVLRYYVGGNSTAGRTLVFLNGLYHGNEAWAKQRRHPFFRKNYRLVFMDYRGTGKSTLEAIREYDFDDIVGDVKAVLDAEECRPANVIGYSVGGMFALWFARLYPRYVESLALISSGVYGSCHAIKLIEGLSCLLDNGVGLELALKLVYPWNHSEVYLEKMMNADRELLESYAKYNGNTETFRLLLKAVQKRPDLHRVLQEIECPTVLISSDEDRLFPASRQRRLVREIRQSAQHVVRRCGHASFIEKYVEVNQLIEAHLEKLNARAAARGAIRSSRRSSTGGRASSRPP